MVFKPGTRFRYQLHKYCTHDNLIPTFEQSIPTYFSCVTVKTHRELFSDFFASLFGYPLEALIARGDRPEAAQVLITPSARPQEGPTLFEPYV